MKRRLLASLALAVCVALGALPWTRGPANAQERGGSGQGSSESKHDDNRDSSQASDRIERALRSYQTYRERSGPNLEQTRKEIDRLRDDLEEVTKLRIDMAISLAEMRAQFASTMAQSEGPQVGGFTAPYPGAAAGSPPGYPSPGNRNESQMSAKDRDVLRREIMHRELKQVQDQLRAEVEQAQGQTDQLAAQLRELRARERQLDEQLKAQHERNRSNRNDNQDGKDRKDNNRDRDRDGDRDRNNSSDSQQGRSPENASDRNK
jgi:septal ring factor EnvC (AmiA/AmiB activator)